MSGPALNERPGTAKEKSGMIYRTVNIFVRSRRVRWRDNGDRC